MCESHDGGVYKVMTEQPALDVRFRNVQVECWTPVFRFALALTNEWDVAEDLAQEAFTRLWVHRTSVDWERPMLPWLLTTTRHLAMDHFRRLRRALMRQKDLRPWALDGEDRVRWLDVQRAMARLPTVDRAALTMIAVSGLSYEEAALVMGTTSGSIRARVSRARRRLGDETS